MAWYNFLTRNEPARVQVPQSVHVNPTHKYRNAFMASAVNRLTQSWYTTLLGPNKTIQSDVKRLRGLSRHLSRNDVYTARYLNLVETRVVGPNGMHFQPRVMNTQGDYMKSINDELTNGWNRWKQVASLDGQSFLDLEQLIIRGVARDGEVFVRVISDSRVNEFGLALQVLDADLLDNDYNNLNAPNGNTIVQGVEVDRFGIPVAYHFWTQHPDDFKNGVVVSRQRIEADEILHVYRPERAGQLRGLPWVTPAMYFLARLHEYMDAELVAAQAAASQVATIETPVNDTSQYINTNDREVIEMEAGVALRLAPGEKMTPWNTTRPTTAFDPFTKMILHGVASALSVSYSTLASDMSEDNYSSARMSGNYEQKHFDNIQSWFIRKFHEKVYRLWLNTSLKQNALNVNGEPEDFYDVVFRGMKMQSPDLLKDLNAATIGFEQNVVSKTMFCAERGYDYREVLDERYEEMKMEREYENFLKDEGLLPVEVANELVIEEAKVTNDAEAVTEPAITNEGEQANEA